jgi:two-component system sensor histidine kinase VicK
MAGSQTHPYFDYPFLSGGGQMGELIRSTDWAVNPLGTPDTWPLLLKLNVSMMLKNSFPVLICWGPDYIQLYNDAFRPINGLTKHPQAMGGCARDTYAEIWETISPMFSDVRSGATHGFPDFMVPLDRNGQSEDCFFDFSYSPIADADGQVHGVLVVCMETTEKVRSLNELKESEARFRMMAEESEIMIAMADASGKSTYFNKAWVELTGKPMEELLAFDWADLLHPEDKNRWLDTYLAAHGRKESVTGEFRVRRKNGDYRWLLASVPVRHNADGSFAGYVSTCIDITERKISEQQVQQLINMLPASVVVIRGPELIVEMINQSNLDYWNRNAGEVIGKPFLEILPDLADQPFAGQLRGVMETGEIVDVRESPVLFENSDGSIRETFVDYTYQPLTDLNGKRTGVLVMSSEITDRVSSRRLLEQSEARFKYLIKEAPVAIGVFSGRELIIESANEMILHIWGKTASIVGQPLAIALPELEGQPFLQLLDDVFTTGEAFYGNEVLALLKNEIEMKEFFLNFVYQPIKNEHGKTTDIIVVATDVTEQVAARKKVERTEESLRMAIEAAGLGSYYINVIDRIFISSPRLKEFFGFGVDEEVPYEAAINQIHPDYRQQAADLVEAAIATGVKFDLEYPIIAHNDGKIRWVRGIGTVQKDDKGVNRYFTGVLHEITEQKQDEIRKNDFIGMVSHELKTPLTSLTAIIQVLHAKLRTSEDAFVASGLDKANSQVKKMTTMINGFLNISRLESGKIPMDKKDFNLEDLISNIILEAQLTATGHEIKLSPCDPTPIFADQDKIGSVISNLLSNAVKYSPKGTSINISCQTKTDTVEVSVNDQGMGIKPEDIEHLFDRYYRVDNPNYSHISGFGIGLYLSSEIVRQHDGKIWVDSEIGTGSTFHFSLPLTFHQKEK